MKITGMFATSIYRPVLAQRHLDTASAVAKRVKDLVNKIICTDLISRDRSRIQLPRLRPAFGIDAARAGCLTLQLQTGLQDSGESSRRDLLRAQERQRLPERSQKGRVMLGEVDGHENQALVRMPFELKTSHSTPSL